MNAVDCNGETPIHDAANGSYLRGHADIVKVLLEYGADVNAVRRIREQTPLLLAADRGHLDVMKVLLENDADVNAVDSYKWTPLLLSATGLQICAPQFFFFAQELISTMPSRREDRRVTYFLKSTTDCTYVEPVNVSKSL